MQPTPARPYDWTFTDGAMTAASRAGLEVEAVLVQAPGWARRRADEPWSPPRSPEAFAGWAAAAVARYGAHGTFWREHPDLPRRPIRAWQVWNEPVAGSGATGRSEFWVDDRPALPAYVALLRATARAIHRTDPSAQVMLAGLTGRSWETLPSCTAPAPPGPSTRCRCTRTPGARPTSSASSGSCGASCAPTATAASPSWSPRSGTRRSTRSSPRSAPPAARGAAGLAPETLGLLFAERRRLGLASVLWHTWASLEGPSDDAFGLAGLTRWDPARRAFIPKPALGAFRAAVRSAGADRARRRVRDRLLPAPRVTPSG